MLSKSERHIARLPTDQLEAWLESLGPNDEETTELVEAELERREYHADLYPHDEHVGLDMPEGYGS